MEFLGKQGLPGPAWLWTKKRPKTGFSGAFGDESALAQ